jgi:hypothetical protein
LPIRLLMNDPPPVGVGGGGTTVFDESGMGPPASNRTSGETLAEGGGAITEGAGKFSFGVRMAARSGAETGGGTTVVFICTGKLENSRVTVPGAAGITFEARDGAVLARSRATPGAGATTDGLRDGVVSECSRATLGAGGITEGARAGATRACSRRTVGAGGINVALRFGAVSVRSRATEGAGAIIDSTRGVLRV